MSGWHLLAVVRGLEALPEPSRVTLVTTSGWIRRGLRFGLDNWRDTLAMGTLRPDDAD